MSNDDWGKDADDKVRQNKKNKRYNEHADNYNKNVVDPHNKFVEDNPELAKKRGIEKLDRLEKIEYNPIEHLSDEITADKFRNTSMSTAEAQLRILDKYGGARGMMDAWDRKKAEQEKSSRDYRERRKEHDTMVAPKKKFWVIFSSLFCGIIGGGLFLASNIHDTGVFGITFMILATIAIIIANSIASGLGSGCCAGLVASIVMVVVGSIVQYISDGNIANTALGFVFGAVTGMIVGGAICDKIYEFKEY